MAITGWQGRRVLVTGGDGFIGSNLVDRLLAEGAEVRALVHYNPFGKWGWLTSRASEVEIVAGDVRDGERVATAVRGTDVVFHLAALIGIPYSYEAPESYVQTNVMGTYNVLMAARRARSPSTSRTRCNRSRRTPPPRSAPTCWP